MKQHRINKYLVYISILTLLCCNTHDKRQRNEAVTNNGQVKTAGNKDVEEQYCYIRKIYQKPDGWYCHVNFVQFFCDEAALAEAVKRNDADGFEIDEKGQKQYYLLAPLYVVNDNPEIYRFKIGNKPDVRLIDFSIPQEQATPVSKNISDLAMMLKDTPIFIIDIKNNEIAKIVQQYTP